MASDSEVTRIKEQIQKLVEKISSSNRPVIVAGAGVRISQSEKLLQPYSGVRYPGPLESRRNRRLP